MSKYNTFEFSKFTYNEDSGLLKLFYKIDELEFVEEINFNPNNKKLRQLTDIEKQALNLSFTYLHLVAGISYYKLFLPENININTTKLSIEQKDFFDKLYFNGLGEFSFRNNVDLRNKINFPCSEESKNQAINIKLDNSYIVPIGGGKDSLVSLEILKALKNQKLYTFSVNSAKPIKESCEISGCENILITRKIAPLLLEINANLKKYNAYNGHIPITSIIAFISVCAGILYNCNTTVISNENSANVGNLLYNGTLVNHQWSKSFEAEVMIHNFVQKYIVSSFNYFSLLRPIYEIHIAKLFSKIKKYDKVFSSCNKNFKIVKSEEPKRWCCNCDKCRFVFLIFAPFIEKNKLIEIFGENLLDNEKQYIGYEELTGFSGHKPFECVGEIDESITAFNLLKDTDFKDDIIVKEINKKIEEKYSKEKLEELNKKYFSFDFKNSLLDDNFKNLLKEFINNNF